MKRLYSATPDGYCGDEDNGQTSAWYVFSALGFYPVTPGTTQYVIGSPLFEKVTMTMEDGKEFVVEALGNSHKTPYIQKASLNNELFEQSWIDHKDIQSGGVISFKMKGKPNLNWATSADARPFSMSTHHKNNKAK